MFFHIPITICASLSEQKIFWRSHSSLSLPLKLSQYPFSQGDADAMYWIRETVLATYLRSDFEIISGPLSQRMCSGMPWRHIASASASMTPRLLMRRATFSAKQARLCSSISVRMRKLRPSRV